MKNENERKDRHLVATVDSKTLALLDALAEREWDGNRSLAIRYIVKEAAEKRGVKVEV